MSTDLTPTTTGVVHPDTGEIITPESPPEKLGAFIADIRSHESEIRELKQVASRWLIAQMDKAASWTLTVPGLKLSAPSPQPVEEFDGPALREALLDLVDEGVLSIEAVDKAVETVVKYEPRKSGINALRKRGGRVAAVVDAHAREVEKARYVSVKPA